jgi:hypothetical protein
VPVDIISSSVNQIIKYGKVIRPILGISFAPDQSVEQVTSLRSFAVHAKHSPTAVLSTGFSGPIRLACGYTGGARMCRLFWLHRHVTLESAWSKVLT